MIGYIDIKKVQREDRLFIIRTYSQEKYRRLKAEGYFTHLPLWIYGTKEKAKRTKRLEMLNL